MNSSNREKELSPDVYQSFKFLGKRKLAAVGFIIFIFSIWLHFPSNKRITNFIKTQIISNPNCPIKYENMRISWFMPGVDIDNVLVAGQCLRNPEQNLKFDLVSLRFLGPRVFPLSLKFSLEAKDKSSRVKAYATASFNKYNISIVETQINSSFINQLIGMGPLLSGSISIGGSLDIRGRKLEQGSINVVSMDLATQQTSIQGISLPALKIGSLELRATMEGGNRINIEKADIGTENADIIGRFKGVVTLNQRIIRNSSVNVEGSFFPGDKITTAIPLVKIFLANKKTQDGFYSLNISGRLSNIKPEIL